MKEKWQQISDNYESRPKIEKIILAIMPLVIIYVLWDFVFYQGMQSKKDELKNKQEALSQEMTQLTSQEQVLVKALTSDPHAAKRREAEQLVLDLARIDKDLEKLSVGLVSANKLPEILYDVLLATNKLRLVGMKTLDPIRLQLTSVEEVISEEDDLESDSAEQDVVEDVAVYKHVVIVEIEGRYFDVVNYLQLLETLPWKFYWESVDYEVESHPDAKVLLEVYTLSTEKGAIGV